MKQEDRLVEITVEIGGYQRKQENDIKRVCMVEWAFREDDFFHRRADAGKGQLLEVSALGTLYGGEDADDIVHRIERAVLRANGGMCHVEVRAVEMNAGSQCTSLIEDADEELQIA